MNTFNTYVSMPPAGRADGGARATTPKSTRKFTQAGKWVVLAAATLFCACTAPGMKLDLRASDQPATYKMGELSINLRSLNAQTIRTKGVPPTAATALGELFVDKLPPYRIGPQDVLLVTVWDHPEITLPLGQFRADASAGMVVDEDGFLYFPYVDKVVVKGLTIPQVRELLTNALAKTLRNPQVDVKVIAYRSQKVYVGGEVRTPAVYNVTDVPFTLAEAVNRAGGFTANADDTRLLLSRGPKSWLLNFAELMASGNFIGQVLLKDGDSLQVPNTQENPVYIMGEVFKPGSFPLFHGNLSLAAAISQAGGILGASADARSIYVIRQGSNSAIDVFHLDARNPATMVLADRFPLNPRDIIYVDAGTLVRWNRVMTLLAPTFQTFTDTAATAGNLKYLKSQSK